MKWPFAWSGVKNTWATLSADGFSGVVPGCIYDGSRLDGGIPIGGLGTGYFTLEGTGKIGYCSIFNDIVPPRKIDADWLSVKIGNRCSPLSTAALSYWGHYPVADILADFVELPVSIGIRAWSPFIVGDARSSNTPCGLFEVEIVNLGSSVLEGEIILAMPSPREKKTAQAALHGTGLIVDASDPSKGVVTVRIPAGGCFRFRFAYAWFAPEWRDSSSEAHVHYYSTRYASAAEVATQTLPGYDRLLKRVLGWQNEIYQAKYPDWMKDSLIQGFYSLPKNSVWIAKTRHDQWWDSEDGWFTHNESHTGCPITETMVCRMHGHFPLLLFFPELEKTTLKAFQHFQISDGEIPFSFGGSTSMRDPRYHCQHPLNSGQYAQMVYRLYKRTGAKALLESFYESARKAIRYQYTLDDDNDGLVNEQAHVLTGEFWPANQFYDIWPWWGTSAYVAGTWLATLAIGKAMASVMQDDVFEKECGEKLKKALAAYDEKLWTGQYYRLWNDPEKDRLSDVCLGNQLMSEWCLRLVGEQGVLPPEQTKTALHSIADLNMNATQYGLVNGVTPDGKRFDAGYASEGDHGKHVFFGENLCAAMTFMYHDCFETGMEIAQRIYEAVAIKSCSPWNQRCLISAETGLPVWGDNYYSNMVVWALPAAYDKASLEDLVQENGLVAKMIRQAR